MYLKALYICPLPYISREVPWRRSPTGEIFDTEAKRVKELKRLKAAEWDSVGSQQTRCGSEVVIA